MSSKLAAIFAVLCFCLTGCEENPTYQGKPLSDWVSLLDDASLETRLIAMEAIVATKDKPRSKAAIKRLAAVKEHTAVAVIATYHADADKALRFERCKAIAAGKAEYFRGIHTAFELMCYGFSEVENTELLRLYHTSEGAITSRALVALINGCEANYLRLFQNKPELRNLIDSQEEPGIYDALVQRRLRASTQPSTRP